VNVDLSGLVALLVQGGAAIALIGLGIVSIETIRWVFRWVQEMVLEGSPTRLQPGEYMNGNNIVTPGADDARTLSAARAFAATTQALREADARENAEMLADVRANHGDKAADEFAEELRRSHEEKDFGQLAKDKMDREQPGWRDNG
jgi:hypothetical protein